MALKYYFDLMSQPARAVYMYMKLNNIPFQPCPVALRKGEHFSEEYQKIHPLKKVPAIDHNGFVLTESVGILRYLAREFDITDHWYPKASKDQAKVDEFLEWQHLNLRSYGSLIFLNKIINPILTGEPVNEGRVNRARKELERVLDDMEKMFLKDTPFLNRNEISVADLIGCCEMEQPIAAGHDVISNRPILSAWMNRVKEETQPYYTEAHVFLEKLKANVAKQKL